MREAPGPARREPAEGDGEQQDEHESQPERRQRLAEKGDDFPHQHERCRPQLERPRQPFHHGGDRRPAGLERVAEVPARRVAEKDRVLHAEGAVEPQHLCGRRPILLGGTRVEQNVEWVSGQPRKPEPHGAEEPEGGEGLGDA